MKMTPTAFTVTFRLKTCTCVRRSKNPAAIYIRADCPDCDGTGRVWSCDTEDSAS